ncbi:Gfo/Idh/MocA family oxidoreductase [Sinorhizobium numidicum]|uniref:Gfo/Idh/MocA family oxidoreductase n=1 Tax=Sinorhizobium numidicum TaxID=680248 RepID=A0ABY8CVF7_9HYPH|nr:Gfo/Idh/MocA family oxidoreductase [Sinorhizobium numidicum]WEX74721.1 Gfo/Idh/MocA family oxidoreductase [Sinorhizobium numidicum]WEX80713.1 Gfo/Idh/MocA family oxidoreductase [Sinorhizobium numidicum]
MAGKGIAVIGAGMIGAAHASGYRTYGPRVDGLSTRLDTVCDANADLATKLARNWGFARLANDWRAVIDDPEIDIVSVCLPNFLHTEVTQAALKAGKHVLCEKPLALSAREARATHDLALTASGKSGTVFNYRRIPAITDIRARVNAGELGQPVQIVIFYQCDYAADPMLPHSWRYEFDRAGPGALLDVGTHAVDLARFILGDVDEVSGAISTISINERFLPAETATGHGHVALSDKKAKVDNDDVMSALLRFRNGAQGFVTASRVAVGMGNRIQVEVYGTKGTARFSNELPTHYDLAVFDGKGPAPFTRMINRPSSPYVGELAAVPHDLVPIGYAESFGFMIHEFLSAIAEDKPFENGSIEDGYRAAQVLDAIQEASMTNAPVKVGGEE